MYLKLEAVGCSSICRLVGDSLINCEAPVDPSFYESFHRWNHGNIEFQIFIPAPVSVSVLFVDFAFEVTRRQTNSTPIGLEAIFLVK